MNNGLFQIGVNNKPLAEHLCPCCSSGQAVDEMHLVIECDAYITIRQCSSFTAVFSGVVDNGMKDFFFCPDLKFLLADYIRALCFQRKQLRIVAAPVHT